MDIINHPGATYNPHLSVRVLVVNARQLIKVLQNNSIPLPARFQLSSIDLHDGAGDEKPLLAIVNVDPLGNVNEAVASAQNTIINLLSVLQQHEIDVDEKLKNTSPLPKTLLDMPLELLRRIMFDVVKKGPRSEHLIGPDLWFNIQRDLKFRGWLQEAAACSQLFRAGLSVLFEANVVFAPTRPVEGLQIYRAGQNPVIYRSYPLPELLTSRLTPIIGPRIVNLDLGLQICRLDPNRTNVHVMCATLDLQDVAVLCPKLKSLVLMLEYGRYLQPSGSHGTTGSDDAPLPHVVSATTAIIKVLRTNFAVSRCGIVDQEPYRYGQEQGQEDWEDEAPEDVAASFSAQKPGEKKLYWI